MLKKIHQPTEVLLATSITFHWTASDKSQEKQTGGSCRTHKDKMCAHCIYK